MQEVEYTYLADLIFPDAEAYSVADVLQFISEVEYPCTHDSVPKGTDLPGKLKVWTDEIGKRQESDSEKLCH